MKAGLYKVRYIISTKLNTSASTSALVKVCANPIIQEAHLLLYEHLHIRFHRKGTNIEFGGNEKQEDSRRCKWMEQEIKRRKTTFQISSVTTISITTLLLFEKIY